MWGCQVKKPFRCFLYLFAKSSSWNFARKISGVDNMSTAQAGTRGVNAYRLFFNAIEILYQHPGGKITHHSTWRMQNPTCHTCCFQEFLPQTSSECSPSRLREAPLEPAKHSGVPVNAQPPPQLWDSTSQGSNV